MIFYTNLLSESQRVNVTDQVNHMLGERTGEDLFLEINFPDREVIEIYDVSIKFEKIEYDENDENRLEPGEVDDNHGGVGEGEGTDPEIEVEGPEGGEVEEHDPPSDPREGGEEEKEIEGIPSK